VKIRELELNYAFRQSKRSGSNWGRAGTGTKGFEISLSFKSFPLLAAAVLVFSFSAINLCVLFSASKELR